MDAEKLVAALKAEIVNAKALVWADGERVVIAKYVDGVLHLTDEGKALVAKLEEMKAESAKAQKKPAPAPDAD